MEIVCFRVLHHLSFLNRIVIKMVLFSDWNELFTTKCVSCGFPIEAGDRWVEALNNNYHSQCFNCTVSCTNNFYWKLIFFKITFAKVIRCSFLQQQPVLVIQMQISSDLAVTHFQFLYKIFILKLLCYCI